MPAQLWGSWAQKSSAPRYTLSLSFRLENTLKGLTTLSKFPKDCGTKVKCKSHRLVFLVWKMNVNSAGLWSQAELGWNPASTTEPWSQSLRFFELYLSHLEIGDTF